MSGLEWVLTTCAVVGLCGIIWGLYKISWGADRRR